MSKPRLVFTSDEEPGYRRVKRGRGFIYLDERSGRQLKNVKHLERIASLAIPPAWTDVWVSREARSHLQATGRDARGRKQYRYHPAWRSHRELAKFEDLVPFGQSLGDLRRRVDADLLDGDDAGVRTVALVVALLDRTLVRVGNEAYVRDNGTFGLTTLRSRHVRVDGPDIRFRFKGKGGKAQDVVCTDRRLARMIRKLQDLPGQTLFRYPDGDDDLRCVRSEDVNDYLREVTGLPDATAKTFRTWGASVLAARLLAAEDPAPSDRAAQMVINAVADEVAATLGNTRSVCKSSYIHPTIIDTYAEGKLADQWAAGPSRARRDLTADERRLLAVLA